LLLEDGYENPDTYMAANSDKDMFANSDKGMPANFDKSYASKSEVGRLDMVMATG